MDFLALMHKIGFTDEELVSETGLNSSPKTRGVLFRAQKSDKTDTMKRSLLEDSNNIEGKIGMKPKKNPPSIEAVLEKAFGLGIEKAKVIDTSTVTVEKWVRWKCLYGCPFYAKDAYHPPIAPDINETRLVLSEYSKAILLNSSKGKALSDIAIRLEEEAYHMGFYKAFALTALPSGLDESVNTGAT
ncbi:MAG: DUF2284 domain-containing protein [Proteobacteria bacterium]|nr:DUF2284 domain-containing protein [Pseudomonadota bacterium]